jgi:hypothetical protein
VCAKWERMWGRPDNQEVGLEAAILERVRNSSLVKWFRADNVAGLKHTAEAATPTHALRGGTLGGASRLVACGCRVWVVWVGRGASCHQGSHGVNLWWRWWE